MNIDLEMPVLEQLPHFHPQTSRNVRFPPEQVFGNKGHFKATPTSQPQKGGVKNVCLNISPSAKLS
jgi:hypothetical protein